MGLFTTIKSLNDEALMSRFQADKDEQAFSEIYRRYAKRLLHFMYRMLNHDEPLAQDKLHDVFTRIIQKPELFDSSRNFKTWIFMVAANECKKHFRREQDSSIEDISASNFEVSNKIIEKLNENQFKRDLKKELSKMSYAHCTTFILRFQEHLSVKEISAVMDCSEGTVKSRTHHCLKILAKKLSNYNPLEL